MHGPATDLLNALDSLGYQKYVLDAAKQSELPTMATDVE
jgi:hypothetical protein